MVLANAVGSQQGFGISLQGLDPVTLKLQGLQSLFGGLPLLIELRQLVLEF